MSRLEELIEEYCPDGVEYKKIKNSFQRLKGTSITAAKMKEIESKDGEIKIFAGGKTVINAKEKDIPNANIIKVPAVLVQSRGVIDVIYYDKPFTFKNEMWAYTSLDIISIKFLYYVLKNNIEYFRDAASSMGSLPQISLRVTEEYKIPVPPLEVQREIVKILDNFTELIAELIAELTARKKQYAYYRNILLNYDANVMWLPLSEVCDLFSGGDIPKNKYSKEKTEYYQIPVYSNGIDENALYGYTDTYRINKPCVTVSARGTIGHCSLHEEPFYPVVRLICAIPKEYLNVRFLYYYLQTIEFKSPKTGIPQLTIPMIKDYRIPIPPIEVQNKIVSILDRFNKLCNDISEGLPAEIKARQKQYEYYRDKLLVFKELI